MEQQDGAGGVATAAKEQAGQVGQTAAQAGGQVAQTTKEQAANVVGEAKQQARDLVGEARTQVSGQAGQQKGRAVEGIRALAGELDDMAQQGGQSGIATEVARQVASRAHGLADHLDRHEPAELLDQVRSYARRRPVVFLAGAAALGVLAGRLTRNLASSDDDSGPRALTGGTQPVPAYDDGYQSAAYQPAVPAYPGGSFGADPAVPGPGSGYEAGYQPGTQQPSYQQPGYQPDYQPGYDQPAPGYQAGTGYEAGTGYDPGYQQAPPGFEPGVSHQPAPGYEPAPEEREWRNP